MMWSVVAAKIIKSGNISDDNVQLSGVWFLRIQELSCLDYLSLPDEADA
jgi:hypothetical protein